MNEEFSMEMKTGFSFVREAYDWIESAISALLFVVLAFTFLGMVISVHGESMEPTLHNGDRLVCVRMFREPQYMDIVVVTKPDIRNNPLIKRVIATEGQTIDFDENQGKVLVDGVPITEPYIAERMSMYIESSEKYPLTIPKGHVFVMGDNRNNSWDSRVDEVGPVDQRYIFGHVVYRVSPFSQLGVPA